VQIALKHGSPQDFGLVEYEKSDQAEKTVDMRQGFVFHGKKLTISYCIPGQRAINIYLKILQDPVSMIHL
jgi:RNA recognition motif-containing protein